MDLRKRAYGVLMGVALGDAMGMPSELWPRDKVKEYFGEITGFLPGPEEHFVAAGLKAGEVTDDTNQTVKVAEAIIEQNGRVDPRTVASKLIEWVKENDAFSNNMLGPSSLRALKAIDEGIPIEEAGRLGDTNGASMRIAPVGIISSPAHLDRLVDNVEQACLPTHHTNIAIAGAAGVASAIATAMESDSLDEIFSNAVKAMLMGYRRGNRTFGASVVKRTYWALRIVEECAGDEEALEDLYDYIGAGVATTESIPTALAIVKLADGDPVKAALYAANLGGDCDTIGAIACGICGGFTGIDGIPAHYRNRILEVNRLDLEALSYKLAAFRE